MKVLPLFNISSVDTSDENKPLHSPAYTAVTDVRMSESRNCVLLKIEVLPQLSAIVEGSVKGLVCK